MSLDVLKGAVDQSVEVRVLDSTDGTPEAAFAFDTGGIALWYRREGGDKVAITPANLAALTTAHTDGGVKYISDGYVRIDVPDAAFATGATSVVIGGSATGMVIVAARVNLVAFNPQDAIRMGLTALPNAAADAAGGLPISDAGGLDLDAKLANTNEVTAARMGALTDWIDGGRLDLILDARASQASVDDLPTNAELATSQAAADDATLAAIAALSIPTVAAIADGVWDEATAGHVAAGSFGKLGADVLEDTGTTLPALFPANFSTLTIASNAALAQLGNLVHGGTAARLRLGSTDGNHPFYITSSGAADGIRIEVTGVARDAIHIESDTGDSIHAVADNGGGFVGSIIGNITGNLSGSVGSVTGAVGSVTGNVGGNVVGSVASVTGAVGSVTGNVGGNVVGSVASVTASVAITSNVKKNQALAEFQFLMTDATTHEPATGLTVTCTRSIDGAVFGAGTLANVTEVANGTYTVDFGAGDLNGNVIILKATATGADTTFERIITQP